MKRILAKSKNMDIAKILDGKATDITIEYGEGQLDVSYTAEKFEIISDLELVSEKEIKNIKIIPCVEISLYNSSVEGSAEINMSLEEEYFDHQDDEFAYNHQKIKNLVLKPLLIPGPISDKDIRITLENYYSSILELCKSAKIEIEEAKEQMCYLLDYSDTSEMDTIDGALAYFKEPPYEIDFHLELLVDMDDYLDFQGDGDTFNIYKVQNGKKVQKIPCIYSCEKEIQMINISRSVSAIRLENIETLYIIDGDIVSWEDLGSYIG